MIPFILILVGVVFAVVFLVSFIIYRMAFYSNPRGRAEDIYDIPSDPQYQPQRERMRKLIDDFAAVPCEHVSIRSHDGLELRARYYHRSSSAPLDICCHGYHGSAIRDFCGGAQIALASGHNVLLIDQRAHGASSGSVISFGILERRDVLSWIEYGKSRLRPDVPVLIYGVSMGAATALMVSGMAELPSNVRGIVADCPFSAPEKIIRKVACDMHLPGALVSPFARLAARVFGGFDLAETDAVESVKRAKVPIMIIHGEDDRFVPCGMSREIHAANPELVTLHTFPDAGHGLSYIVDTPRYTRAVCDFVDTLNIF